MPRRLQALTWTPEFNVALFAFLLNLPWELWQVPLFEHMPLAPHWEAVKTCSRAAAGDAVIALVAYWAMALVVFAAHAGRARSRCRAVATGPVAGSAAIADLAGAASGHVDHVQVTRPLADRIGLHVERWEVDTRVTPTPTTASGLSASIDSPRRA